MFFRNLSVHDPAYKKIESKFKSELKLFEEYSRPRSSTTGSGKASSYRRYLIRFLVITEELLGESISILTSKNTIEKLAIIKNMPNFDIFNKNENHFYSATFKEFNAYVVTFEAEAEDQLDFKLNNQSQNNCFIPKKDELVSKPIERKEKVKEKNRLVYPRNPLEMLQAKINSDWTCEFDNSHQTFISGKINKPFVEGHHLIPMLFQEDFNNTIDFADNIVTLCPNCHRKIHHGTEKDEYKMIESLFKKREHLYPKHGVKIDLKKLSSYYACNITS